MASKQDKIPDLLLRNADLHKSKLKGGQDIIVPDGVSSTPIEKFSKVLSKMALYGGPGNKISENEYMNLFNYYLQSVLESKSAQRMDRYEQMDFIIENDPALALTRRVLVDEMLQMDIYNKPLTVTSPNSEFKRAVESLFSRLGIKSYLREVCSNLISYGDSFMLLDIRGTEGVQKVIPIDPRDVRHRFEFSIAELKQNKNKLKKRFTAFQAIIDMAETIETQASQFNKFLLGFQVLNTIFPFWQILHFRQYTTRNTIAPFGKPTFYESQSEARMYLNAKVVVSMIRSSAFMREHIKVKTSTEADPAMQWETVSEVKQMMEMFLSSNGNRSAKDYPSFGEKYYYPEGLIDIEKSEAGYNFRDRFEDLDMMRQDVFTSTGLPKEYFVGGENRQYVSKESLIAQDKKAARQVYTLQGYVIDQLIKLVEVHFSFTGEFDPYSEEFTVSLPYPVPDVDEGVMALSNSKMQYALTLITSLKSALDVTRIPTDIVRNLLITYFPLKDEDIDNILVQMSKDSEEEDLIGYSRIGAKAGDPYLVGAKTSDIQVKSAEIQARMAKEQQKMMKSQVKAQDLQLDAQKQQMDQQQGGLPSEGGDAQVGGESSPEGQEIANIHSAIQTGSYDEPTLRRAVELGVISEEEYGILAQGLVQTGQQVEYLVYKSSRINEAFSKYVEAVKKKPLVPTFEAILYKSLIEKGEEFTFSGRHYLTNRYSSPDRNISELISQETVRNTSTDKAKDLHEGKSYKRETLKSGVFVNESKPVKKFKVTEDSDESSVQEDIQEDRRYSKKSNKKVL